MDELLPITFNGFGLTPEHDSRTREKSSLIPICHRIGRESNPSYATVASTTTPTPIYSTILISTRIPHPKIQHD